MKIFYVVRQLCEFAALSFLMLFIFELYVNDFKTTCIFNV